MDRELLWLGSSRTDIRAFPAAARRQAGFQLQRVQQGLDPSDWKPMRSVGAGVREIRIQVGTAHRVFYVAAFAEAVYVLHAFEKRIRRTAKRDLNLGRERYRDLVRVITIIDGVLFTVSDGLDVGAGVCQFSCDHEGSCAAVRSLGTQVVVPAFLGSGP